MAGSITRWCRELFIKFVSNRQMARAQARALKFRFDDDSQSLGEYLTRKTTLCKESGVVDEGSLCQNI